MAPRANQNQPTGNAPVTQQSFTLRELLIVPAVVTAWKAYLSTIPAGTAKPAMSVDNLLGVEGVLDAISAHFGPRTPAAPQTPVTPPAGNAPAQGGAAAQPALPTGGAAAATPAASQPSWLKKAGKVAAKWIAIVAALLALCWFALNYGFKFDATIGQTTIPIVNVRNLQPDLDAATKQLEDEQKTNRRLNDQVAALNSRVIAANQERDQANAERNRDRSVVTLNAVKVERDEANRRVEQLNAANTALTARLGDLARVNSRSLATIASLHSQVNDGVVALRTATDTIDARNATIASLQSRIAPLSHDIEVLRFQVAQANGAAVRPNGLVDVEILAPAMPRNNTFTVHFEQKREFDFPVTVTNGSLDTQRVVQVPAGLYTVTRIQDGQPFGQPIDVMVWSGAQRAWFQFNNDGWWREVVRNNPFITFWNGVGLKATTLPNGNVVTHDGHNVTVDNGRVVALARK